MLPGRIESRRVAAPLASRSTFSQPMYNLVKTSGRGEILPMSRSENIVSCRFSRLVAALDAK